MKKIFAFFCAAATIVAAASCTQNGIDVLPDNNEGVTFTANACDITKISIDDEFHAYWNAKDKISLMDSNGEYEEVLVDAAYDGMATAVFNTTRLSPTADRYFAMACDYNATDLSKEDNSFKVERGNIFSGTIGEAYVGYAGSDSKTLTFDCLTAIIRFTTTESHETIVLFSGDNEQFYTSAVVTPSTDPVSAASVYQLELLPTAATSMIVKPDNAAPGTYYIGIFPGTYNCLDFAVTGNAHATIYGEVTLEAGKIYDFGDIDSRLGYNYFTVTTPVFTADEAEAYNNYLYGNIGNSSIYYSTEKGGAANAPVYNANSSEVRLYQAGSGQTTGGVLTIESTTGDQIKGVQLMIGSTDATFAYTIGNDTVLSDNIDVPKGTNYTLNGINSSKVTFYCTGTDKTHRLVFTGIRVTYVEDGRTAQQLSFPIPTYDLTATIGETFNAPTVEGAMTPVTYTSSNPEVATVDATTGAVTLVEPGTTVITATAEESDVYKAASASYNLTVVEAGITSLKALQEKLLTYDKATDFTAEVTNAIVTSISENGLHFYLEDAEAGVYCYNISENGLAVGDCLTGTITGRGYNYNGIPELTKFEFEGDKGSASALPESSVSLADFAGDGFQTYLCRRVKLTDVTIGDGFGGTDREGTLVEGQYTVGVRTASASSVTGSYIQGSVIDLVCIPSFYKPTGADVEGRLMIGWDADITVKSTPTPTDIGLATLKPLLLAATKAAPYGGSVILENAVITGVTENNSKFNFYLEDAGAAIYCYGISGLNFDVVPGTTLDGTITVSGYNYSNGIAEVTTFSFEGQTSVSSDIPVTEVTTASLEENYDDLACRRIKVVDATITDGFGGSDRDGTIMQDNTAATIRTSSASDVAQSYSAGATVSIVGFPIYYNGNHQISVISDSDVVASGKMPGVITAATTKQMYVGDHWEVGATANSGATVSYSIDNSNVAFLSPVAVGFVEAKSAGTCTLTMTAPETDQYTAASLTCTITVVESSGTLYFEKVTSAPNSWEGTYLIVYTDGNLAFNGSLETLDAVDNYVEVSINSGKIEATETMRACAFTIGTDTSIDGYYIKSASGLYIGETTDENKIKTSSTTMYANSISFESEDDISIVSGGPHLRFNSASNQMRFRYYKTASYQNQKAIQLYRLSE